ncbi:MAG: hypothetical protein J7500_13485 [Sphingomonas sp.]|uniref:hypothetical protein n=1 Tax=Sphingomonas sp. TaxID=28214 RepID=UPI001B030EB8|nr:hypothetical protein [Sphingomonas sp.]MBO9623713.1 hypothetical protein [Sphingomonas sp.]
MSCVSLAASSGHDPYSDALHRVIAGELREMRDTLEKLAEVLVGDEHFATAYLEQLQSFDYLIQHADECVNLLDRVAGGQDSLTAIGHVRLGAVQERLRAALQAN